MRGCRHARLVVFVGSGWIAQAALSANIPLTWLDYSPVPLGQPVPNNSVYVHPALGNVTVTWSFAGAMNFSRFNNPLFDNGSVTHAGNTYLWGVHDAFDGVCAAAPNAQWRITWTFTSTQPAGSVYLGVAGLGRTSDGGGAWTAATVQQNGTFLGDWSGGGNYGPTEFNPSTGSFWMRNSVAGPGGANPWWNTPLALVRIDDAVSSLTVVFDQLPGDGVNLNIAAVPAPGGPALAALAGLWSLRRRRG